MSTINPITRIGDVIRGSLLVDEPKQIGLLLDSVTKQVQDNGGNLYIKNFWENPNPLSKGYVGVHIKMRMPLDLKKNEVGVEQGHKRKFILMELQLHFKAIMDGTQDCAKEIAHHLYKAPEETEEEIPQKIISGSQLVFLTAMTRLFASPEKLKEIERTCDLILAMTKSDRKMRLFLETAILLGNKELNAEWNKTFEVVVPKEPKDEEAVAKIWMETANKISEMLKLPTTIIKINEGDNWTNTAETVDELYADAQQTAHFFREMCEQAAKSQPGCSVNYGPGNNHMIKEKSSLLNKVKADREKEELARFMPQFLIKIKKSLLEITRSKLVDPKNISALKSLYFSLSDKITDSDLGFLLDRLALKSLSLNYCHQITDRGLVSLSGRLTMLQSLDLSNCNQITDKGLASLSDLTRLQNLRLNWCYRITDRGLAGLSSLIELQSLDLYWCLRITNRVLASLRGLTKLQSLNFSGCYQITNTGLVSLAPLTALRELNLSECDQITDKGLLSLALLTALRELNLSECDQITDKGLLSLAPLTALQKLDLSHCNQITDKGLNRYFPLPMLELRYSFRSNQYSKKLKRMEREILSQG